MAYNYMGNLDLVHCYLLRLRLYCTLQVGDDNTVAMRQVADVQGSEVSCIVTNADTAVIGTLGGVVASYRYAHVCTAVRHSTAYTICGQVALVLIQSYAFSFVPCIRLTLCIQAL